MEGAGVALLSGVLQQNHEIQRLASDPVDGVRAPMCIDGDTGATHVICPRHRSTRRRQTCDVHTWTHQTKKRTRKTAQHNTVVIEMRPLTALLERRKTKNEKKANKKTRAAWKQRDSPVSLEGTA